MYAPNLANEGYGLISPKLTVELNKAGSLTFILPPSNVMYDSIQKLKSIITVYQDGDEIFRGRVLHDEKDFYNRKNVYCEGELAFLLDSVQRPYTFQGDIPALFEQFINAHNEQVEEAKQFNVGEITVTDPNNYINRSNTKYPKTWDEISDKLISSHGGYLRPRISEGKRYIDLVQQYGKVNSQIIEFGINMLDISEYISAEDVFTVLIPLGAEQTDENGNSTGRLTIASVNDGKDYIEDEAAIALFGRITKIQEWDDVTVADNLLTKGNTFLQSGIELAVSLTMKAVDLHLVDVDTERIGLGDYVRVISLPHNLDKHFLCSRIIIDLVNADKTEFTLGVTFTTITEKQMSSVKVIQNTITSVQSVTSEVNQTSQKVDSVIANNNQKYLFSLLTNNEKNQSMTLDEATGDIYINASYVRPGILTIGGVNDENAKLEILNDKGTVCVRTDADGIKILQGEINATSGTIENVIIIDGITIAYKGNESTSLSLVKIAKDDNDIDSIIIGEATTKSTPLVVQGSSIVIKAASNVVFENNIEVPSAYFNEVYFETKTENESHLCKIYNNKEDAIGLYDVQNDRGIWVYDDAGNIIGSDSRLSYYDLAVTLDTNANAVSNKTIYYPFLQMVYFNAKFTIAKEITANTIITLGTIDSTYAPKDFSVATVVYTTVGPCEGYITVDGAVEIKCSAAIAVGETIYINGCWNY